MHLSPSFIVKRLETNPQLLSSTLQLAHGLPGRRCYARNRGSVSVKGQPQIGRVLTGQLGLLDFFCMRLASSCNDDFPSDCGWSTLAVEGFPKIAHRTRPSTGARSCCRPTSDQNNPPHTRSLPSVLCNFSDSVASPLGLPPNAACDRSVGSPIHMHTGTCSIACVVCEPADRHTRARG